MSLLPRDRFQHLLTLGILAFFAASCIRPPYVEFLLMQHAPTIIALLIVLFVARRFEVSRASFTLTILFLTLHTLGARYLYSYTPYDDWTHWLTGRTISETFGWTRNHYDRLVHFCFGLLLAPPIQEVYRRGLGVSMRAAAWLALESIVALSGAYEMLEWLVAVVFTPTWAESFLGQQGDIFDGQKDMALATAGAIVSLTFVVIGARLGATGKHANGNAPRPSPPSRPL
jgi:putative membrane protein